MKLNGKNIIFDEDITMTGKNLGKKLSDILGELDSKNSKLEKYLKWIYNYGGVGGSGGSGGGSSDSSGFILYSELNGIHLNNQVISLSKPGSYVLSIDIQKPQGATFSVTYSILDKDGVPKFNPVTVALGIENSYHYEVTLNLDDNATIKVEAVDSIYGTKKQETASFVTKSYDINIDFVTNSDGSGGGRETLGNEIPTADALSKGLNVVIGYDIAVSYKELRYSIIFNTGDQIVNINSESPLYKPVKNTDSRGEIAFDLIKEVGESIGWAPTDENAGYYSVQVIVEVVIEGSSTVPIEKDINFNLIPPNLYLLVSPTRGTIYTEQQSSLSDVYFFSTGAITFNVEPYRGSDRGSICNISCTLDNRTSEDEELVFPSPVPTQLRVPTSVTVYTSHTGWNKVLFRLDCEGQYYPSATEYKTYYFYVKQPDTSIDWYTKDRPGTYNYYRGGTDQINNRNMTALIKNTISGGAFYRQTSNSTPLQIVDIETPSSTSNDFSTVFHFGIQYNEVNVENATIFTANAENGSVLTITQSEVKFNTETVKYYLPKTDNDKYGITDECRNNFHLLSVVFRYVKSSGYDHYYEFIVYVDGVIEGACQNYLIRRPTFNKLTIEKANIILNLAEISYPTKELDLDGKVKNEDLSVYQYFLKYKSDKVVNFDEEIFDVEKSILNECKSVRISDWGDVVCDLDTVDNIATKLSVPTLVLTIENTRGQDYWKNYLENSYEEDSTDGGENIPVAVRWAKEKNHLKEIECSYPNASFFAKIQGSSTKTYKCKNFNLTLTNNDSDADADVYVYSPNFNTEDVTTFLPEQTFTLKADVVDSSHSNNTSIGRFVNNITTKFKTNSTSETLGAYVRNCLDGFPFVLFLQFINRDSNNIITSEDCYFQGMYNFNLGRESFFNLGYKDLDVFCNSQGRSELQSVADDGGFLFYSIPSNKNDIKDGLIVAEIQGNSPYFDFSQYDDSILYETLNVPKETYMFDDFVHGSNLGSSLSITKQIIKNMVEKVSYAGGYLFDYIRKEYSDDEAVHCGYDDGYEALREIKDSEGNKKLVPANQVPNYRKQFGKRLNGTEQEFYLKSTITTSGNRSHLDDLIIGNIDDNRAPMFDFTSLSEYYTICMAFGLVDSVQKNMNIKCWNADPYTNLATFYAAFYDMDTSLGINNQGLDVSYFAFSDFWSYTDETAAGSSTTIPSQVTIYRDFSPKKLIKEAGTNIGVSSGDFYDTASSYLFAVAKYARLIINSGENDSYTFNWPRQLWSKWRAGTKTTDKTVGCLMNADEFMNNYFANNLGKVSVPLINMNYRNKYLVRISKDKENGTSFNQHDFEKFSGTRIAKTRDWLSNRFHILDAYFNLGNSTSVFQYYDEEGNYKNINTSQGDTYLNEPEVNLSNLANEDIIIRNDIFNPGTSSLQGSGRLDFIIRAKEYSPLIIDASNVAYRYLLGGVNNYNVKLSLNGTQNYKFGGSSAWTYLDSINSFEFNSLYVNSKYLTELNGSANNSMTVNSNSINMPSLKNLTLTGRSYSGNLVIDGSKLTNLDSINISQSQINLTLNNSNLSTLDISRMDYANYSNDTLKVEVNVIGCPKLTRINFGSGSSSSPATKLKKCSISPVPEAVCRSSYKTNSSGGLNLNYTAIETLSLQNSTNTGGYSRIKITNDSSLKELSLSGFAQIYIENCRSLSKIILSENDSGDKINNIFINNCGSIIGEDGEFNIGDASTSGNVANLEAFKELKTVAIKNCIKLRIVKFDPDRNHTVELPSAAFSGDINLEYLSAGNALITGPQTFYNCNKFTLKNEEGDICVNVKDTVTSLSGTFYNSDTSGSLQYSTVQSFIKNNIPTPNNITDISNMFVNQGNMRYDVNNLNTDLRSTSNWPYTIDMSKFNKVTNVTNCFAWCGGITAYHYAFWNFGANATNISSQYYHTCGTSIITIPKDIFKNVINKIDHLGFSDIPGGWGYARFSVIDPTSRNILNNVPVKDIFHPNGKHPVRVSKLRNIGFANNIVDLTDVFNNWTALTEIENFMWDKTYIGSNVIGLNEVLNHDLPGLRSVYRSFNINNEDNPVNLVTLCNWEQLLQRSANIFTGYYHGEASILAGSLNFYKYIYPEGLNKIIRLLSSGNVTGIDNLFKNCLLLSGEDEVSFGTASTSSFEKIKSAVGAFNNFRIISPNTSLETVELQISDAVTRSKDISNLSYIKYDDIFKVLNKVINMGCMFYGNKIGSPITYDFFHRRTLNTSDKYIVKSGMTLPTGATYFDKVDYQNYFEKVSYNNYIYPTSGDTAITSLVAMFKNCFWKEEIRSFDPTLEANNIMPDHLVKGDGTIIKTPGTKYYVLGTRSVVNEEGVLETIDTFRENGALEENIEISEAKNLAGLGGYVSSISLSSTLTRDNFAIQEASIDRLFIAPDFFYPCRTGNCNISSVFSNGINNNECLEGMIPEKLLKNVSTSSFAGLFTNLNIIPRKLWTENQSDKVVTIYYYIPRNFTRYEGLNGAFNFHFMLPAVETINPTLNKIEYDKYYLFLSDSIPSGTTTLSGSLPSVCTNNERGLMSDPWPNPYTGDYRCHYGIFYNDYTSGEEHGGTDGIDLAKFKNLNPVNLVTPIIAAWHDGNIFKDTTTLDLVLSKRPSTQETSCIINTYQYSYSSYNSFISRYCILPRVANATIGKFANQYFISFNSTYPLHLRRNQCGNGDNNSVTAYDDMYYTSASSTIVIDD